MRCYVETSKFKLEKAEAAIVAVPEGADSKSHPGLAKLDGKTPFLAKLFESAGFKGEADQSLVHLPLRKDLPSRLVFVGLGKTEKITEESHRRSAALAAKQTGDASSATFLLGDGDDAARVVEAAATGFFLARYKFDRYLSAAKKKKKKAGFKLGFSAPNAASTRAAAEGVRIADAVIEGVYLARDLGNLPGNLGTPIVLAREAAAMAKREKLRCKIHDETAIGRLKMGSFLSVSLGGVIPPRFIEIEYGGGKKGVPTIALIGKGVTFDSGGISIKPAGDMDKMRYDKCGAAAVIGATLTAARLKLPVRIVALIPATENMPGKNANKPGDVVTAMNGKTIEILNTDAEGRLILADALCYAERFKPDFVVDLATLTGACAAFFANHVTGMFGSDDDLCTRLFDAGQAVHERVWRLPLYDDYDQMMKGTTTDLKNLGGARGGAINAASFLKHFAGGRKWAHLDIAGTAWDDAQRPYNAGSGSTGVGVRLLTRFLSNWVGAKPASVAKAKASRKPKTRKK